MSDTLVELRQEIQEGFNEVANDIGLFHNKLCSATVQLEEFRRKTKLKVVHIFLDEIPF